MPVSDSRPAGVALAGTFQQADLCHVFVLSDGLNVNGTGLVAGLRSVLELKQRIEEEVEVVREILGNNTVLTGFYSYGEISPHTPNSKCELHNQTMTITTFREV